MESDNPKGDIDIHTIKSLIDTLRDIRKQEKTFPKLFKEHPERLTEILTPNYYWSEIYEYSLFELLLMWIVASTRTGGTDELISEQEEKVRSVFYKIQDALSQFDELPQELEPKYLFGLSQALVKNIQCLETFSCSLNYLISQVKIGHDAALFKAVRIDHSIVSCPSIADRITRAELLKDKVFFRKLSNAIRTRPAKQMAAYSDLRYTLAALNEMGLLEQLKPADCYQLFSEELGLYPKRGGESKRNLAKLIERWKEGSATRKNDFMSATKDT